MGGISSVHGREDKGVQNFVWKPEMRMKLGRDDNNKMDIRKMR
jgi:hypothetical protein